MHYYLSDYTGTGRPVVDPFRVRGQDQPGAASIDLRPDGSQVDGRAWLALPVRQDPRNAEYLGESLTDPMPGATKTRLGNAMGVTFAAPTLDVAIAESLTQHARQDGTRVKPLQPSKGVLEIYLGGRIWAEPTRASLDWLDVMAASIGLGHGPRGRWSRREWLIASALALSALSLDAPVEAAVLTDTFTGSDSAALAGDLTWTEVTGTSLERVSNEAKVVAEDNDGHARAEHDLPSIDHRCQVTVVEASIPIGPGVSAGGVLLRFASAADTAYLWQVIVNGGGSDHDWSKFVAGAETQLAQDTTDAANGELLLGSVEGSTLRGHKNGGLVLTTTDTGIAGGTRVGIRGVRTEPGAVFRLDNLVASGGLRRLLPLGVGR
jgi:hypothetical protein